MRSLECPWLTRQLEGTARHAEAALRVSPDMAPNLAPAAAKECTLSLILIVRRVAKRLA